MKRSDGTRGCLSQESLGILAIRIAQGAGDPKAPGEGSPEYLSVDLFPPDEKEMREHLESCPVCRERLLDEVYSVRRYLEGLENPENIKRFDKIMKNLQDHDDPAKTESDYVETILYFDAYGQGEEKIALAAASESFETQLMRFSSKDGKMILREYPGSSPGQSKYQLIADDQELANYAEVIIGEQSFQTNEQGLLELKDLEIELSKSTEFRIRSRQN